MESKCPIDKKWASEISSLLQPPTPVEVQEYFEGLISSRQYTGIKVNQNSQFGKGVHAGLDFKEGELVLKDQMLVGIQHLSNKIDCLVCSFCFRFIGSIELQIGRKLYLQNLGVSGCDDKGILTHISNEINSSNEENDYYMKDGNDLKKCTSSSSTEKVTLPKGVVESLMSGELPLPHSKKFPLPSPISCSGGCGEAYYCSKLCAEADWESSHSLLCTGERSESLSRDALLKFIQHADETNDIFLLAAKTIAFTILRYRKLKATYREGQNKYTDSADLDRSRLSLLLEAWKPISIGYKRRWWECVSLPDDIDCSDETAFRMEIRDLAFTSLQLLKAAIFDQECEPLFSLEIYGNMIGMFELNNLDLVVASPVEDYFLYIDDLPYLEKRKAEEITQPILDALGDGYSVCCQGTAFYPLQSCMNHSCCPNARAFKREEDRDGQATIIALKPICYDIIYRRRASI
ncbi:histone-lysine N-methyltransferase ATXR2 isoform X2 [Ricinus communis]|uniref:histone-lysine N-methyltransferase ATXR2 isoform X2 n=1 Tax=Ricinus communis TaxID=3988 RepID=UPI000772A19E|nr:histone-lysine N-methyltransferase ATXR2 isoform X2 [Ricinus communis]|eukprot:XP_015572708.1 histone-lysine N-methyltransferase ATXR2 isoform X2 [Ricinus communis]